MSIRSLTNLIIALIIALISTTTTTVNSHGSLTGNDTTPDTLRVPAPNLVPAVVIQQRPEHVINSYDAGHHYEQPPNEQIRDGTKPLVQLMDVSMISSSNNDADLYIGVSKPEPRNEIEDPVQQPQPQSAAQQDPAIIDHRPPATQSQPTTSLQDSQQPTVATIDTAQQQTTSTQAPPVTAAPPATSAPVVTYTVSPQITSTLGPATQPQPTANFGTNSPVQSAPQIQPIAPTQTKQSQPALSSWYSAQQPINYQQQATSDTSSATQTASASNQVMTSVQHPNSINAIITSDNQPRSLQSNAIPQQQVQAAPSQQIVTVNGQPMLLVNPNGMHTGGRRISISGWLKNISNILTNIFNRREHGSLPNGQSSVSGGGPLSHWMLGSGLGGHSWLSGAQQMVQQPHMMLGSNRHQHQSLNYVQQPPTQQLPVDLQTSASSNSYATITSPQSAYQPPLQMIQLNHVGAGVRQAPPIPLQQSQQVQTSLMVQPPSPSASSPVTVQASSRPAPLMVPVPPVNQQNSAQHPIRSNRSPSNSGLPLAHYSRYSANMD